MMHILTILTMITLAVFTVWISHGAAQIGAVSKGTPIGQRPKKALLLIDLQTVFWEHGPYTQAAKAAAYSTILDAVAAAKAEGTPVVAIRQEWSTPATRLIAFVAMKGQALAGSPGIELAAPFAGLADEVLVKRVQDAFETGELDQLLARLDVGTVSVVGLDFNYCVAKTALAARQRGFDVEVLQQGALAADQALAGRTRATLTANSITLL